MKDESCHDEHHFLVPLNAVIACAAAEASVEMIAAVVAADADAAAAVKNVVPQGLKFCLAGQASMTEQATRAQRTTR